MPYSIRAGLRIRGIKNAKNLCFEDIPEPSVFSLCVESPSVKEGDEVQKFEKIGENGEVSVFAPASAKVKSVKDGIVELENDFLGRSIETRGVQKPLKDLTSQEICDILKEKSVLCGGMPVYKMITDTKRIIINLMQTQPYLCSMSRLALENTAEILGGAKVIMKACGARRAVIAVEADRWDVVKALKEKISYSKLFEIKLFVPKYPQEDPRQLIYALDGREIASGKDIKDEGYTVVDGFCCFDTYRAFVYGEPSVTAHITAEGDCITTPKNLRVPIGTPISHIIEYCGGLKNEPYKIIEGGVMTGRAVHSDAKGIEAGCEGVTALSDGYEKNKTYPCIRCARCVEVCPVFIAPTLVAQGKKEGAEACIQCGLCSYVCPSNIPLTQKIHVLMKGN